MSSAVAGNSRQEAVLAAPRLFGEGQQPEKMQGHWVLARVGKRVLRPGGIELTRKMLEALAIGSKDRVVEFAPGVGRTARMVLKKHPTSYTAVERDGAAAENLRLSLAGTIADIRLAHAEDSGLPKACASVVFGEAMLTMQTPEQKERIIAEAVRLLMPGGRYGIHEICFQPDDLPAGVRREIQAAMSKEIHVGVQPLTLGEWGILLERQGLRVTWCGKTSMQLLEPGRLLRDEGVAGMLRIASRLAVNPVLRQRVCAMRGLFHKYGDYLGAVSVVGVARA